MTHVNHLLSSYLDRELAPDEIQSVEKHLAQCQPCCQHLEELKNTINMVKAHAPGWKTPEAFNQRIIQKMREETQIKETARPAWIWPSAAAAFAGFLALIIIHEGKRSRVEYPDSPAPTVKTAQKILNSAQGIQKSYGPDQTAATSPSPYPLSLEQEDGAEEKPLANLSPRLSERGAVSERASNERLARLRQTSERPFDESRRLELKKSAASSALETANALSSGSSIVFTPKKEQSKGGSAKALAEWSGTNGPQKSMQQMIKTREEWRTLWKQLGKPAPIIDFSLNQAVAIFAGKQPGQQPKIAGIQSEPTRIIVLWKLEPSPSKDAHPYIIRLIPRTGLPVIFKKEPPASRALPLDPIIIQGEDDSCAPQKPEPCGEEGGGEKKDIK